MTAGRLLLILDARGDDTGLAPNLSRGMFASAAGPGLWAQAAIFKVWCDPVEVQDRLLARTGWPSVHAQETADILRGTPITPRLAGGDRVSATDCVQCLVFSAPLAGREAEYDAWYSGRHLRDVLAVPGYVSAQRFAVSGAAAPAPFLALYEIARDAYETAAAEVARRSGTERMPIPDAVDRSRFASAHYRPASLVTVDLD